MSAQLTVDGRDRPVTEHTDEEKSKDTCFKEVAELANKMIEQHGSEFAMGTLVLAAKFIAEGKPLTKMKQQA